MQPSLLIRKATKRDSKAFLHLLVSLADFEHLEPPSESAKRRVVKDVFEKERVELILAFLRKKAVGYALYYYTYSSFLARPTLYLEDIFVLEELRRTGVGRALFSRCASEALKHGCGRLELAVLTWNKNAIDFYEKLGATRLVDWYPYRLSSEAMKKLVALEKPASGKKRS
jgi:GNAT superfamily N-acetyltransferase